MRSSRNLGGPVTSVGETGLGIRSTVPGPQPSRLAPAGTKPKAQRRYREAKETKQRGKGDGKSECSHSTKEAGEPTQGTP
jgi:hypothetical protein